MAAPDREILPSMRISSTPIRESSLCSVILVACATSSRRIWRHHMTRYLGSQSMAAILGLPAQMPRRSQGTLPDFSRRLPRCRDRLCFPPRRHHPNRAGEFTKHRHGIHWSAAIWATIGSSTVPLRHRDRLQWCRPPRQLGSTSDMGQPVETSTFERQNEWFGTLRGRAGPGGKRTGCFMPPAASPTAA